MTTLKIWQNFGCFAPQARHNVPINMKFGTKRSPLVYLSMSNLAHIGEGGRVKKPHLPYLPFSAFSRSSPFPFLPSFPSPFPILHQQCCAANIAAARRCFVFLVCLFVQLTHKQTSTCYV